MQNNQKVELEVVVVNERKQRKMFYTKFLGDNIQT